MSGDKNWVCVGTIGAPHGVTGEVRVRAHTEDPFALKGFDDIRLSPELAEVTITSLRQGKANLIVRLGGIKDRNAAESLKGKELCVPREALPKPDDDEYYLVDLEGLIAVDKSGSKIGTIKEAVNYGAGDLIILALDAPRKGVGKEAILPFKKSVFPMVDLANGQITVALEDWLEAIEEGLESAAKEDNGGPA